MSKLRLPTDDEIWKFSLQVPMATKDYGVIPIRGWGTQRYLVTRITQKLQRGIHQFVILKARQVGASTIMLLLTLYWMWRFDGMQGLTVTDSDENKQYFRDLFLAMIEQLAARQDEEECPAFDDTGTNQQTLRTRNIVQITWKNQSRLLLQTAGKRTWSRLGVGRGLSFLHGTEVGLWAGGGKHGGPAVTYLRSAFSEINPAALFVFEGTARGKNFYYDLWLSALEAKTIDAIFLGWYLREDNRIKQSQKTLWDTYADPKLTSKEREWDRVVRRREKVTITRAQWAWRRWYVAEKAFGSTRVADQEMPTIWEDAFNASQDRPFLDEVTCDRVREGLTNPSDAYIYRWGPNLEDTSTEPVPDRVPPMLRVWALPDHRPVVIAAVPAHAIIEDDPQWVISVWAADLARERIEQVAEFSTELTVGLQPFAWTCLHLTGSYRVEHQCFILEINGLGMGVLAEIKRLIYSGWGTANTPAFRDLLGSVRHYIWRRPDSIGAMGAYQWKSTDELQAVALHRLRDQIQRGIAVVRSEALLDELERLEGHGEGFEATGEMPRAHRAYAAALAMESYSAQLYPELRRYQPEQSASSVAQLTVQRFLSGLAAR